MNAVKEAKQKSLIKDAFFHTSQKVTAPAFVIQMISCTTHPQTISHELPQARNKRELPPKRVIFSKPFILK